MRNSRRQFMASTFSTIAMVSSSGRTLAARKPSSGSVDVRSYGALGNGYNDDTRAFARAFQQGDDVFVPAGTYSVSQISIPAGKRMITAGASTVLRQRPGEQSQTPIVRVIGSNVEIGSFSAEGNIYSDVGEWMHAISVVADDRTGDLSDIVIGDVAGKNLRGDVLYLGSRPGFNLSRVKAGNISCDNIYRNVVSITGTGSQGGGIRVESVTGTRVGLFHFDIEPESVPVIGISVGSIKGQNVSVCGQTADGHVSSVDLGVLDLSPTYGQVNVADPLNAMFVRPHAYQQRNATGVSVGGFRARGFDGQAILFVDSSVPEMTLHLSSCDIEDCSRNDGRNAFIMGQPGQSRIVIDHLRVVVPPQKAAMLYCDHCLVGSVEGVFGSGAGFLNSSPGAEIRSLKISGDDAVLAWNTTDTLFAGGSVSAGTLAYNCDHLSFKDISLSGAFRGGSADQQHLLLRSTLNGSYYEESLYTPFQ